MATPSKSAQLQFYIKGKQVQPATEWQDLSILATFEEGNPQANITTEQFTFILDAYTEINQHLTSGLTGGIGIMEGLPFDIAATSTNGNLDVFKGFIDTQNDLFINDTLGQIEANIKKLDSLNTLNDRLSGTTFDYLYEIGVITDDDFTDLEYVVEIVDKTEQAIILSIAIFSISKTLIDSSATLGEDLATIASFAASVFGAIGAPAYQVAIAIVRLAYFIALLMQLTQLIRDLINTFIPPIRTHKCINLKTALEKISNYFNYPFNTSISELDNMYYLPSNINYDITDNRGFLSKAQTIEKGIPQARDFGFLTIEFFELVANMFNARYGIFKGKLEFHTELSLFWRKQSTYQFPNILEDSYKYNTTDLKSNIIISFNTDLTDEWTIENYKGTNYQVITDAITVNDEKKKTIIGLDEVRIPLALANRKDELNFAEKLLKVPAGLVDGISSVANVITFGAVKKTNFISQINSKIGIMKVGTNNHSVPKLVWLENGKLPKDHREKLSAKSLWNYGVKEKSFLTNNFQRQRRLITDFEIPFGFSDYLKLIDNSYFTLQDGRKGKVEKLEWNMDKDTAIIDYYIEDVYTKNLEQTFIEPE